MLDALWASVYEGKKLDTDDERGKGRPRKGATQTPAESGARTPRRSDGLPRHAKAGEP